MAKPILKSCEKQNLYGAIIGKALYEGKIKLERSIIDEVDDMLAKRIIPCLDVDKGRVVKGKKFQNLTRC